MPKQSSGGGRRSQSAENASGSCLFSDVSAPDASVLSPQAPVTVVKARRAVRAAQTDGLARRLRWDSDDEDGRSDRRRQCSRSGSSSDDDDKFEAAMARMHGRTQSQSQDAAAAPDSEPEPEPAPPARSLSSFIVSDGAFVSEDDGSPVTSPAVYHRLENEVARKELRHTERAVRRKASHCSSDGGDSSGSDFDKGLIYDTTRDVFENSSDEEELGCAADGEDNVRLFSDIKTPRVPSPKPRRAPKVNKAKSENIPRRPKPTPDVYEIGSDTENIPPAAVDRPLPTGKRVLGKPALDRRVAHVFESPSTRSPVGKRCDMKATPVQAALALRATGPCDFLKSLSPLCATRSTDAHRFVGKSFKRNKEPLVQKLYVIYNEHVFDNMLPTDLAIEWNKRLRKTAGLCKYRRSGTRRTAKVELSDKVCDSAERVRDTLLHELCHAAVWLVNGDAAGGHGTLFKAWGDKAIRAFPTLPLVQTCHDYHIRAKYNYVCTGCGQQVPRHSKSLDVTRKICGICRGAFELRVNGVAQAAKAAPATPAAGGEQAPPHTPSSRPAGPFALYVKEHYGSVKRENGAKSHKDVMGLLSTQFKAQAKV